MKTTLPTTEKVMVPRSSHTARQVITNVWPVFFKLAPTYKLPDVSRIDSDFLRKEGIELVIWDVDGTLMPYHETSVPPRLATHLRRLANEAHAQHAILSNCGESRFLELGSVFPELPVFRGYTSDDGWTTRIRRGREDSHSTAQIEELLVRGARHVRKPDARLVPAIMQAMGVTHAPRVLVVGDQYLTDVATAHLAGARSAKVETWDRDSFPRALRLTQRLETLLSPLLTLRRP